FANALYPNVVSNPVALTWKRAENPYNVSGDPRYPLVATTFRLTEHHTAGTMSRNLPWLAELQPEMFAEIDPILARERGIEDGGWMTILTERAEIEARAMVSDRMRPLRIDGQLSHQVALPWHWGSFATSEAGTTGDAANDLVVLSGDANTTIQESKAFSCDVRPGRRREQSTAKLAGVHERGAKPTAPNRDHIAERPLKA
ncbi:MAG: molybdopterin dinucleotide binding domain-containing protein, partial [Thermoleophilaceae bacterium]